MAKRKFEGNQEYTRLLFSAIAYEKLDKIASAIAENNQIIRALDVDDEILICAKFKLCICEEKTEAYDSVRFDEFILHHFSARIGRHLR